MRIQVTSLLLALFAAQTFGYPRHGLSLERDIQSGQDGSSSKTLGSDLTIITHNDLYGQSRNRTYPIQLLTDVNQAICPAVRMQQ